MSALRRVWAGLAFALLVGYAVHGVRTCRARALPAATAPDELRGVWHVHTARSDGRGTLEDVVRVARAAGASFVVVTDHDQVVPAEHGWRGGVLVIEGMEVSTSRGHVVALGLERPLSAEERGGDALAAIARLGGRAVLAHPHHPTRPFRGAGEALPWIGFEVFSNDTAWHQVLAERAWDRLLAGALDWPFDGGRAVLDLAAAPRAELARFDAERAAGQRAGGPAAGRVLLCSADAHGYPSYAAAFRAVTMHVPVPPTGDGGRDARAVAAALLDGSAVCVLEGRGTVTRVRFEAGADPGVDLELPAEAADATVRLLRSGVLLADRPQPLHAGRNRLSLGPLCGGACPPGEYRVELWRGGEPWIFTNPARIE